MHTVCQISSKMSHYFKEGGWISMINFYFGQNLAHCAWWWWLFGVSFSPLPSTMVEVVVVDDIVAVILWKIPLGSAFWVWKCQRQNRGRGDSVSYFMTCIFIHCTIMRMVFKSRVCVCQLISQLQQNIYACRFSRKRKIQIPQEMPPCSMYDFTLVCMHLSC